MNEKNKNVIIVGVVILVVLLGGFLLLGRSKGKPATGTSEEVLPQTEVVPTVDSSVQVELTSDKKKTEVTLTVKDMPKGTKTIEYELSYNTQGDIPKGTSASPVDITDESLFVKKITLGTCSSGTCVYDKLVGPIKVTLRFEGSYGKKSFEKEFTI